MTEPDTAPPMSIAEAIAQVSAVLDNLRSASVEPAAAVNPDGSPGYVAAGELIESAWGNSVVDTLNKRHGCGLQRTVQSIPSGGTVEIAWDTEIYDSDAYHAVGATSVVVPADRNGVYAATLRLNFDTAATTLSDVWLTLDGVNVGGSTIPATKVATSVTVVYSMSAGQVVKGWVYNGSAAAKNISASIEFVRVAMNVP